MPTPDPFTGASIHRQPGPPRPESAARISIAERHALFLELQPLVKTLIRRFGGDHELRKELYSEIYCRFCALLEAYDPDRGVPLKAYLIRSLPTAVHSFVRAYYRTCNREVLVPDPFENYRAAHDPTADWDWALVLRELTERIPAVIARLPLRQRQVVILHCYQSQSYEAIARELHISAATARSLMRYAIRGLRRLIKEDDASRRV